MDSDFAYRGYKHASRARQAYEYSRAAYSFLNKMAPYGSKAIKKRKLALKLHKSLNEYQSLNPDRKKPTKTKLTIKKQKSYSYIPAASAEASTATRTARVAKNRVNRKVSFKKKPYVKVTRKFREKVKKSLMPAKVTGRWREISYSTTAKMPAAFANNQNMFGIGQNCGTAISTAFFTPAEVLDCASVLFNNKTPSQTKATASGLNTDFGTNTLDARTVKIEVLSSSASIVIKNNTSRTVIMQLYECSPKVRQNFMEFPEADVQWRSAMTNEATTTTGMTSAINLGGADPNTLYATPFDSKPFMQVFNVERHDITMDAGQSYDHFLRGPSGVYDFAKYWRNDTTGAADQFYNHIPSKTRFVFVTYRYDLVSNGTSGGRFGDQTAETSKGGVVFEYRKNFHIVCPENTAGILPALTVSGAATLPQQFLLNGIKDIYYFKNWNDSVSTLPDFRIDAEAGINQT